MKTKAHATGFVMTALCVLAAMGCQARRIPDVQITPRTQWATEDALVDRLHTHAPKYLTIHHAGVKDDGSVPGDEKMRRLFRFSINDKGWGDVPYHFVIDREGGIFEGRSLDFAPDTNTGYEVNGHLGICVNGDLTTQPLREQQYRALVGLLVKLSAEWDIPNKRIAGHMDHSPGKTDCPGVLEAYIRDGTLCRNLCAARQGRSYAFEEKPRREGDPGT